jgi:hypothetical protein
MKSELVDARPAGCPIDGLQGAHIEHHLNRLH